MAESRLAELQKMGFRRVLLPAANASRLPARFPMTLVPVRHVREALDRAFRE